MTDDFYLDQPKLTQNRIDLSTILKSLGAGDSIAKLNEGVTQLLEHVQKDIDEARQNLTKNAKLREHLSKNNLVIDETTKEIYHSTSYEPIHIGLDRASILYEYMLGSPNLVELDNFFKVINKLAFVEKDYHLRDVLLHNIIKLSVILLRHSNRLQNTTLWAIHDDFREDALKIQEIAFKYALELASTHALTIKGALGSKQASVQQKVNALLIFHHLADFGRHKEIISTFGSNWQPLKDLPLNVTAELSDFLLLLIRSGNIAVNSAVLEHAYLFHTKKLLKYPRALNAWLYTVTRFIVKNKAVTRKQKNMFLNTHIPVMLEWYGISLPDEVFQKVDALVTTLLCDRVYGLAKDNASSASFIFDEKELDSRSVYRHLVTINPLQDEKRYRLVMQALDAHTDLLVPYLNIPKRLGYVSQQDDFWLKKANFVLELLRKPVPPLRVAEIKLENISKIVFGTLASGRVEREAYRLSKDNLFSIVPILHILIALFERFQTVLDQFRQLREQHKEELDVEWDRFERDYILETRREYPVKLNYFVDNFLNNVHRLNDVDENVTEEILALCLRLMRYYLIYFPEYFAKEMVLENIRLNPSSSKFEQSFQQYMLLIEEMKLNLDYFKEETLVEVMRLVVQDTTPQREFSRRVMAPILYSSGLFGDIQQVHVWIRMLGDANVSFFVSLLRSQGQSDRYESLNKIWSGAFSTILVRGLEQANDMTIQNDYDQLLYLFRVLACLLLSIPLRSNERKKLIKEMSQFKQVVMQWMCRFLSTDDTQYNSEYAVIMDAIQESHVSYDTIAVEVIYSFLFTSMLHEKLINRFLCGKEKNVGLDHLFSNLPFDALLAQWVKSTNTSHHEANKRLGEYVVSAIERVVDFDSATNQIVTALYTATREQDLDMVFAMLQKLLVTVPAEKRLLLCKQVLGDQEMERFGKRNILELWVVALEATPERDLLSDTWKPYLPWLQGVKQAEHDVLELLCKLIPLAPSNELFQLVLGNQSKWLIDHLVSKCSNDQVYKHIFTRGVLSNEKLSKALLQSKELLYFALESSLTYRNTFSFGATTVDPFISLVDEKTFQSLLQEGEYKITSLLIGNSVQYHDVFCSYLRDHELTDALIYNLFVYVHTWKDILTAKDITRKEILDELYNSTTDENRVYVVSLIYTLSSQLPELAEEAEDVEEKVTKIKERSKVSTEDVALLHAWEAAKPTKKGPMLLLEAISKTILRSLKKKQYQNITALLEQAQKLLAEESIIESKKSVKSLVSFVTKVVSKYQQHGQVVNFAANLVDLEIFTDDDRKEIFTLLCEDFESNMFGQVEENDTTMNHSEEYDSFTQYLMTVGHDYPLKNLFTPSNDVPIVDKTSLARLFLRLVATITDPDNRRSLLKSSKSYLPQFLQLYTMSMSKQDLIIYDIMAMYEACNVDRIYHHFYSTKPFNVQEFTMQQWNNFQVDAEKLTHSMNEFPIYLGAYSAHQTAMQEIEQSTRLSGTDPSTLYDPRYILRWILFLITTFPDTFKFDAIYESGALSFASRTLASYDLLTRQLGYEIIATCLSNMKRVKHDLKKQGKKPRIESRILLSFLKQFKFSVRYPFQRVSSPFSIFMARALQVLPNTNHQQGYEAIVQYFTKFKTMWFDQMPLGHSVHNSIRTTGEWYGDLLVYGMTDEQDYKIYIKDENVLSQLLALFAEAELNREAVNHTIRETTIKLLHRCVRSSNSLLSQGILIWIQMHVSHDDRLLDIVEYLYNQRVSKSNLPFLLDQMQPLLQVVERPSTILSILGYAARVAASPTSLQRSYRYYMSLERVQELFDDSVTMVQVFMLVTLYALEAEQKLPVAVTLSLLRRSIIAVKDDPMIGAFLSFMAVLLSHEEFVPGVVSTKDGDSIAQIVYSLYGKITHQAYTKAINQIMTAVIKQVRSAIPQELEGVSRITMDEFLSSYLNGTVFPTNDNYSILIRNIFSSPQFEITNE